MPQCNSVRLRQGLYPESGRLVAFREDGSGIVTFTERAIKVEHSRKGF